MIEEAVRGKNMIPRYLTGQTSVDGQTNERTQHDYHTDFRFEGEDLIVDSSNVMNFDFGWGFSWKTPALTILVDLALEMAWFKRNESVEDSQFGLELGPNLVLELRGNTLPTPTDLNMKWYAEGKPASGQVTEKY